MTKPLQIPPAAYDALLDNLPFQVWQMTYDCSYGRVNKAHAAFLGKPRDQIEKQPVEMIWPQPEASVMITRIRSVFESRQRETHEQWLVDAEGNRKVMCIDMAPVTDDAGVVQFLACSAVDLTEQWEAERDLELCRENADAEATKNIAQTVDLVWSAVSSLVHLAETLDENASMHLKRLSESCRVVATVLSFNSVYSQSLDYDFIHMLQQACLLHDIGKAGVPDSILLKPGKLTREEFDEVKKHTTNAAETLLQTIPNLTRSAMFQMAVDIALSHHERWDGKGYPVGLKGDEIPLSAQIVAICDVYDALRSVRPYKPALTHEVSMTEIRRECGTQFNPALCDAFFHCEEEIRHIYDDVQTK
jgi:putative two-component system response regulator